MLPILSLEKGGMIMARRIYLLGICFAIAFALLAVRLFWLTEIRGEALAARGQEQQVRSIDLYEYDC